MKKCLQNSFVGEEHKLILESQHDWVTLRNTSALTQCNMRSSTASMLAGHGWLKLWASWSEFDVVPAGGLARDLRLLPS